MKIAFRVWIGIWALTGAGLIAWGVSQSHFPDTFNAWDIRSLVALAGLLISSVMGILLFTGIGLWIWAEISSRFRSR